MVRTSQPKKRQALQGAPGFRKRMRTANGRKVLARRRARGRAVSPTNRERETEYGILIGAEGAILPPLRSIRRKGA